MSNDGSTCSEDLEIDESIDGLTNFVQFTACCAWELRFVGDNLISECFLRKVFSGKQLRNEFLNEEFEI